jgi:hypothetical protein
LLKLLLIRLVGVARSTNSLLRCGFRITSAAAW